MTAPNLAEDVRKVIFYRYRTLWSYGPSSWQYEFVFDSGKRKQRKSVIERVEEEQDAENQWSEHYRGADVEFPIVPDAELIGRKLNAAKESRAHQQQVIRALEAIK